MGTSYVYVNLDKRQHFRCGLCTASSGFAAIGHGPGARALALLLCERGSWHGDRISVLADSSDTWDGLHGESINIEPEVLLMLIDVDGMAWLERPLAESSLVFSRICTLASHLRHAGLIQWLDRSFGAGKWQRRQENYLKENTPGPWLGHVIAARDRALKLIA